MTACSRGGQIAEAERLDRIAKGIVIAHRQEVVNIPWLGSSRPLADRLDAFKSWTAPLGSASGGVPGARRRRFEVDLKAIEPYVAEMQAVDPVRRVGAGRGCVR